MRELDFQSQQLALKKRNSELKGQLDFTVIELAQAQQQVGFYSTLCWVLLGLLLSACFVIFMVVVYAN
jgi:hypothetical protein